ncbi:MAG TPA: metalloregulator ArsR/SmtB family transcription factor [Candidatus Acidoferrales bacterium]|nr:metalloregulator ArsR/SmtB family transcription factor [Candidatus Acidoferrales bacterium]
MNPVTFSALAEPNRFQIVELLRDKPRAVGELVDTLHIRQPQVSKHLKVLADAGIVEVRPLANQRIYELSPKKFQEIDAWLEKYRKLWIERFDRLDALLQREKQKGVKKVKSSK